MSNFDEPLFDEPLFDQPAVVSAKVEFRGGSKLDVTASPIYRMRVEFHGGSKLVVTGVGVRRGTVEFRGGSKLELKPWKKMYFPAPLGYRVQRWEAVR